MRRLVQAALIVALSLCLVSIGAAASRAGSPPVAKSCGTLRFDGAPYGVQGVGVGCQFMRTWTRRYQRDGKRPSHWSCVGRGSFTEGGSCDDRRSKDYFEYYIKD